VLPSAPLGATLPHTTLELASDGLGEPRVGIGDHELDASKAPFFAVENELRPEGLGLTIAHLETQQFTAVIGINSHGDHRSPRGFLLGLALPPIEEGGVQVDIDIASLLQQPPQESLVLLISLLTDATHLRLGDAALGAQG
jgi:hypothetical protein